MKAIKKTAALSIILFLSLLACKKNKTDNGFEEKTKISYLMGAASTMKTILPEDEFVSLDWGNGEITKTGVDNKDIQIVVKSRHDINATLTYLMTGDMKIYQWNKEVHTIFQGMKIIKQKTE